MTEKLILKLLHSKYKDTAKYKVSNVFLFGYGETDFFIQQNSNDYCYDIEIKISRADFFRDLKKIDKHVILKDGFYFNSYGTKIEHNFRPNKFVYCVPEGLIKKEEVPEYAGLFYVNKEGHVLTIKEPKFLHKETLNFENTLCSKFYWYWKNSELEIIRLKKCIDKLEDLKNGKFII